MAEIQRTMTPIHGPKVYQERARRTLPILVRQAEARKPIYYSDLAAEVGISNPRNLNYVLGCIGETLQEEAEKTGIEFPPIQCLVINKTTEMPGEGIAWFLDQNTYSGGSPDDFRRMPTARKRDIVEAVLQKIYLHDGWRDLLQSLNLPVLQLDFSEILSTAAARGGGESADHKALKTFVAMNPPVLGLPARTPQGETEVFLPSGDVLDVSFRMADRWVAAEVKSSKSGDGDLVRGLFQCVKYTAVMDACARIHKSPLAVDAVLILEGRLPEHLIAIRNILGVRVIENIVPE
jgi:hypothetical protein